MEKVPVTTPAPSAPMPSAPPSYEEAIGLIQGPVINPPYPMTGAQMPMPTAYPAPMPNSMSMPQPAHVNVVTQNVSPGVPVSNAYQNSSANPQTNQVPEVRNVNRSGVVVLGPNPVKLMCPSCHRDVKTTIMSDHQPGAHVCCIILCLFGCCLCSCLPYCLKSFMNIHHFCPKCKAYIGTWST